MDDHPLRIYRQKQKPPLSQTALARKLGVTRVTVWRWETGERFPDRDLWPRIERVTGIAPTKLVEAAA